jgi:S-adenosylmethionine:tRNA ribosyltransferase-isomerase
MAPGAAMGSGSASGARAVWRSPERRRRRSSASTFPGPCLDLIAAYDYELPPERIAHAPAEPRDHSRLLYARAEGNIEHLRFDAFPALLRPDDVLVYNTTRVIKARLRGVRVGGGKVELLVLGAQSDGTMRAMARPARRIKPGTRLRFGDIEVIAESAETFRFPAGSDVQQILATHGEMPLPPYIEPPESLDPSTAYQSVFARDPGSIAAPTASLHFTDRTLEDLRARANTMVPLHLTVGLGTFAPVRGERLDEHIMHTEPYEIPAESARLINAARASGRRIVAVGTTVMRALEGSAASARDGRVESGAAETSIFIKPGFHFRVADVLLTNFHLPRSTLLVLVSTFAGHASIREIYAEAIAREYRFFSFGDAMLIERAQVTEST